MRHLALIAGGACFILSFACASASRSPGLLSAIQQRLDELNPPPSYFETDPSTRQLALVYNKRYGELFSRLQTPKNVAVFNSGDVQALFQAAQSAAFYTVDPRYVRDMQLDLSELQKRGVASQLQYNLLYREFIDTRQFSEAQAIARTHPADSFERYGGLHPGEKIELVREKMAPVPDFHDATGPDLRTPTFLSLSSNGRELIRRSVRVDAPAQIIVTISPDCEFAQGGIQAIEADPTLRSIILNHTIWLIPPPATPTFESIARWNRSHPDVIMHLAYDMREWPMIDRWETPTFYFLRQGKLVGEVVGWHVDQVDGELRRIGLMKSAAGA